MRHFRLPESRYFSSLLTLFLVAASLPIYAADAINFSEIKKQALFASVVYGSEKEITALAESNRYRLNLYHTIPDIQVTFFLATNEPERTQLISVRGTTNVENAVVDIALKLLTDEKTGARLHQGFAYAARRVYAELKPLLKPGYKIHATGHSLGGAVALIVAMYLDADRFEVDQVVTFGQPKVTNLSGATSIQHLNITRVVTATDLVPLVPPFDPLDLNNIDIYWHAGKELILLDGDRYALLAAADSMLRATQFTRQPLTEENVKNHYMRLYLDLIEPKTKSARRVTYRNDFNLFNLFGNDQGS
jgi:hypothetical protein